MKVMVSKLEGFENLKVNKEWTLFLDRDGVINEKIDGDYIKNVEEFKFCENAVQAIKRFNQIFGTIVVVTNQQGIGKGIMGHEDLERVHNHMLEELRKEGVAINKIYYCPKLAGENPECRKPNTGMGMQAQMDFPQINFSKSIMVGDSLSDIQFGDRLGMYKVYIVREESRLNREAYNLTDFSCTGISELANFLV